MAHSDKPLSISPCRAPACSAEAWAVMCRDCSLDPMCAILDYAGQDSGIPDGVLLRRRRVRRGETIFRSEDPFRSIFAVASGSFKAIILNEERLDRVIGFYVPGELIGTQAMAGESYQCTARALEDSSICELRLHRLPETGRPVEVLQKAIIELLTREIAFNNELITALVRQTADQRVAGFLFSLATRMERHGLSGVEFKLSMSRADIGNYLGLASETVTRILTRFHKTGVLRLQRKRVHLLDRGALAELANA